MGNTKTVAIIAILCYSFLNVYAIGCKDQRGNNVDWFVAYKLPVNVGSDPNARSGFGYVYTDVKTVSQGLVLSSTNVAQNTGALFFTLSQIYNTSSSISYMMYNDEKPDGTTSSTYGHTKGVLGFDGTSGFWLVQSTPRWPPLKANGYAYGDQSKIYGQTFLCVTYSASTLNDVGTQLMYNRPQIYDSYISASVASAIPNLASVISGSAYTTEPKSSSKVLRSLGGTNFISFSKNSKWNQDLYNVLVAPYFRSDLYVETWMRPNEPACCIPTCQYNAMNVKTVAIPKTDISFIETKDHAKWAITVQSSGKNAVCIGDINRNKSQWTRAGGTVCVVNAALYNTFAASIADKDSC